MSPVLRFFGGVGAVVAVAVVGWLAFSAMQRPTPTAETTTTSETPAQDSAVMAAERERLQRERDDALAAARTAEQRLASERAQRQSAPPPVQQAQTDLSSFLGDWVAEDTSSGCGRGTHRFVVTGATMDWQYRTGSEPAFSTLGGVIGPYRVRGNVLEISGRPILERRSGGQMWVVETNYNCRIIRPR